MTTKYGITHNGTPFYMAGVPHEYTQAEFQTHLIKIIIWESSRNPGLFTLYKLVGGISKRVASASEGKKLTKLQYAKLHA